MADASPKSIQLLIDNSEKGLAQIEVSLPIVLKTRKAVEEAIKEQSNRSVIFDLTLAVLDTILAEQEVIYDITASLNALLKATNDYTKRYYMQSLNLCYWEACQLYFGLDGDEDGLLTKLGRYTKELNQAGCLYIAKHIINDIEEFRKEYCDKELRDITRHYDDPIKMYEKQQALDNIDFFAKGASEMMAIHMEVSVLSTYLLSRLTTMIDTSKKATTSPTSKFCIKGLVNKAIFKELQKHNLKEEIQRTLDKGQRALDECYRMHKQCLAAVLFLEEMNCEQLDDIKKMESLIRLRMETLFLRNDVAGSVWGYLNATTDMERSQNLRLIYITKQAALTHIYGYNEKVREKSLWSAIKSIEEANNEILKTESVEKSLQELTGNLAGDKENSQIFAHYRYKQDFYIPARIDAFDNMEHHKELIDAMKLLNICKALEEYIIGLLFCMDDTQKQKKEYDKWMGKIDGLVTKFGNNERLKEAVNPIRELIDKVYGDKCALLPKFEQ